MPKQGSGGSSQWKLRDLVNEWARLDKLLAQYDEWSKDPTGVEFPEGLDEAKVFELRTRKEKFEDRIVTRVQKDPSRWKRAVELGFSEAVLHEQVKYDSSSGAGPSKGSNDSTKGEGKPGSQGAGGSGDDGKGGKGGKGGPGSANVDPKGLLPKGGEVVSYNGKTYIAYNVKVKGTVIPFMMGIRDDQMDTYGINPDKARALTKKQFQRHEHFGNVKDVINFGDGRNPFEQWVEKAVNKYEGTSILQNREVLSVFLEGYVEGWGQDEIQNQLRLTKWWDSKTRYQRRWEAELTDAEKRKTINSERERLIDTLEDLYGSDWMQYVDGGMKKVRDWAEKIASGQMGAMGNPEDGYQVWFRRQRRAAENIEETPAWIEKTQKEISDKEFINQPENIFEDVRAKFIEWLGPMNKPDQEQMKKWADDLFYERRPEADLDQHLRKQAKALHPWLNDEESWTEGIASFKGLASELLGQELGYDDKLFASPIKMDQNGVADPTQRMSSWEFAQAVKSDDRFFASKNGRDSVDSMISIFDRMFNGTPAGV